MQVEHNIHLSGILKTPIYVNVFFSLLKLLATK